MSSVLHVDMDAFFAAVEVLENPELAGKPLIVGGSGERGVVASCSYEARAYGIHSAMPSLRAQRLCPHAIFVPGRYDRYATYSRRIHEVFRSFTPIVEGIALDEAFLDVAGARRLFGPPAAIATAIRQRLQDELGLSSSVGVAPSKMLAKLASEAAKPKATLQGITPGHGVVVIERGEELDFLHPLPVRALWGVGPATATRLRRFGVVTIGDLARVPFDSLVAALGPGPARHLHDLAWARDDRAVTPDQKTKSVSHEETYSHDIDDHAELHREVVRMADAVAQRLRRSKLAGRTVTIKVRYHDFATITRSHTVGGPVDTGPAIARVAAGLLEAVDISPGVRLLGVAVTNLGDEEAEAAQLSFDDVLDAAAPGDRPASDRPADGQWAAASKAIDLVRDRYGDRAVGPAALADGSGVRVKRRGDQQWGPDARR